MDRIAPTNSQSGKGLHGYTGDGITPVGITLLSNRTCLKHIGRAGRQAGDGCRILDTWYRHAGPGGWKCATGPGNSPLVTMALKNWATMAVHFDP
jgi:hypothetical protein